jgi:hypothetical protein
MKQQQLETLDLDYQETKSLRNMQLRKVVTALAINRTEDALIHMYNAIYYANRMSDYEEAGAY